jgi:hypothetical protein
MYSSILTEMVEIELVLRLNCPQSPIYASFVSSQNVPQDIEVDANHTALDPFVSDRMLSAKYNTYFVC